MKNKTKNNLMIGIIIGCMLGQLTLISLSYGSGKIIVNGNDFEVEQINDYSNNQELNAWEDDAQVMYVCNDMIYMYIDSHVYFLADNTTDVENIVINDINEPYPIFGDVTSVTGNESYLFISYETEYESTNSSISLITIDEGFNSHNLVVNTSLQILRMSLVTNQLFVLANNATADTLEILCYNVTNPEAPNLLGNYSDSHGVSTRAQSNMIIDGTYVYLTRDDGSVVIIDYANSTNPVLVKEHTDLATANMIVTDDYLIATTTEGLVFYDKTDSINLAQVAIYTTVTPPGDIAISEDILYMTANDRLYSLYISDVNNIQELDRVKRKELGQMIIEGSRLYIRDYNGPFLDVVRPCYYIYDISNPANIVKLYHSVLDPDTVIIIVLVAIIVGGLALFVVTPVIVITIVVAKRNKKGNEVKETFEVK